MEKLLSIVIPVYKVEKYIDKCISSLLVPDKKQLQLLSSRSHYIFLKRHETIETLETLSI